MSEFKPPEPFGSFLEARKTSTINVRFGDLAQGPLVVKKAGKGKYRIKKQPLTLTHPAFSLVAQFAGGLTPALFIRVDDSKVVGEVGLADGEKFKNIAQQIQKAPEMLGLGGFTIGTLPTITNTIDGGSLHLGLKGVSIKLGSAFAGKFNFAVLDSSVSFDGSAAVVVKGLANGSLELKRAPSGLITGKAAIGLASSFKLFSGNVEVAWDGVSITGVGKVGYKGEKFSGEVTLFMMERIQAEQLAKAKQAPPGTPAPAASNKKPARVDYAIFGEGNLGFSFTPWLSGTAQAIFDAKGNLTVIGELRPQKEFNLFNPPQKDYVKELFKLEIHATYGLSPIADVFIFASVGMDLFAKLGPARIYDIFIKGTYSTDPTVAKNFSIGGSLNLSAAAGVRLRIEAGAGLEILGHDIKAGAGITGIAGIKAYAKADPVVGYREKAAEGQDLKGEWFISGTLEMAAQPFLGLGGDLFIELETPWWSPLSDDRWTWPLFNKEWPLGGVIGMLISVEHVFGSGQFPKFDLKPLKEFNSENCLTELYKDNAKSGPGKPAEQKGQWAEKNTPAANPPPKTPQPGNLKPGKPAEKGNAKPKKVAKTKGKAATPDAKTKGGKSVEQYQTEKQKKGKGPKPGKAADQPQAEAQKNGKRMKAPAPGSSQRIEIPVLLNGVPHKLIFITGAKHAVIMASGEGLLSTKISGAIGSIRRAIREENGKPAPNKAKVAKLEAQILELIALHQQANDAEKVAGSTGVALTPDQAAFKALAASIERFGRTHGRTDISESIIPPQPISATVVPDPDAGQRRTWCQDVDLNSPDSDTAKGLFQARNNTIGDLVAAGVLVAGIAGRLPTDAFKLTVDQALRMGRFEGVNVRKFVTDQRDKFRGR
jgi:hypothetical protein